MSLSLTLIALLTSATPATSPVVAPVPVRAVTANGETRPVATRNDDAADDPAIWHNAKAPAKSLIVGTDKKAGLHSYTLNGTPMDFAPAGRVNNVDIAEHGGKVIVGASDRNDLTRGHIALYTLSARGKLGKIGRVDTGAGEAYGFCFYTRPQDGALFAFQVMKDGRVDQVRLDLSAKTPRGTVVRSFKLATQSEGCVVDARTGQLYVGEEDAGIWQIGANPADGTTPTVFAAIDGKTLVADVEGLAVVPHPDTSRTSAGWLIASSQGDNTYVVFDLETRKALRKVQVVAGANGLGATSETDGIEASAKAFGPDFPNGLFIVQDGDNAPKAQNFKLVDLQKLLIDDVN